MINSSVKTLFKNSYLTKTLTNSSKRCVVTNSVLEADDTNSHYTILKLNKPPVNSLNLEAILELNKKLDEIEKNDKLKGVILTSSVPNVFTGGLDIMEMYQCETKRLEKLWTSIQDFWIKLYGSKKVYIAAMNVFCKLGHALGLGCVIAMSCDYRIMADSDRLKTGLNAALLGINASFWFKDTMLNTIGQQECEKALKLGKIFTPKEALKIKLVDEIVEPASVIDKAKQQMENWCKIPTIARQSTKISMRKNTINRLMSQRESDTAEFIRSTMDPALQKTLENYLNSLKNKKNN